MKEKIRHKIALRMIDPSIARENKQLNPILKDYIDEAHELCQNAGGALVSRQAIACLILDWQAQYPNEKPFISKNKVV